MPELDRGLFCPPPPQYKIGGQNIPYKLGLRERSLSMAHIGAEEIPMGHEIFSNLLYWCMK